MSDPAATPVDAVFRPVRGRVVPQVGAVVIVVVLGAVAAGMGVLGDWSAVDQVTLVGFGLLVAAFVWRYSRIRAVPEPDGLTVRNLMLSRTVTWDEIVLVRFLEGDPWVSLELQDGEELAVMAVQRADGPRGRSEAERLRRLVAAHRPGR